MQHGLQEQPKAVKLLPGNNRFLSDASRDYCIVLLVAVVTSRLLGDTVQEEHLFPDALSYYYSRTVVQLDTSVGLSISLLLTTSFVEQ